MKTSLKKLSATRRKTVSVSAASMIKAKQLHSDRLLPLVVEPFNQQLNLLAWAKSNRTWIEDNLSQHGGILLRFKVSSAREFEEFIEVVGGKLLDYTYRSTPRSQVEGKIYTSTEYPANQSIPLHNEMAYSRQYPQKIGFFCPQPAKEGGETPIADSRRVFENIKPEVKERFRHKQVMYVRNYGQNLDLPWQNVFQTTNKSDVEDYCTRAGIEWEWLGCDRLRTRQVCQAIATHPYTKEEVWFNQAHLFHISNLPAAARTALLTELGEAKLPRNAYYGDGEAIEASTLESIRAVYDRETIKFSWAKGDVLLLDNMLAAHGRMPFVGSRQVLVGMT